eukprot:scaffold57702_cov57-Phaeocystis_antarctica.AAC.1
MDGACGRRLVGNDAVFTDGQAEYCARCQGEYMGVSLRETTAAECLDEASDDDGGARNGAGDPPDDDGGGGHTPPGTPPPTAAAAFRRRRRRGLEP